MNNIFEKCAKWFSATFASGHPSSIRQRLFRLVLSAGLVTFIIIGALTFCGMFLLRDEIRSQGTNLGESAANQAGQTAEREIQERLLEVARMRAQYIDNELSGVEACVTIVSDGMTRILQSPSNYVARTLPEAHNQPIQSGEAYVFYGRKLRERGVTPALAQEIGKVSNVVDYLVPVSGIYGENESSIFVGSRHGYLLCVDNVPGGGTVNMTEDFLKNYDPTERPWFVETKEPVFHDIYIGAEGYPSLTCSAAYADADGFAGVVAMTTAVDSINRVVESTSVGHTGFSVMVNGAGKVMLSPKKEGELAWSANAPNLVQSKNQKLAAAALAMTKGEEGIQLIELDGEEYFLAYAPMESVNWSFCTLIAKKEVIGPAEDTKQSILSRMGNFEQSVQDLFTRLMLAAVMLFLLIAAAISRMSSHEANRFVQPILALSDGVLEIAGGNLKKRLDIKTGDEIEQLAGCVNNMSDELQNYMQNLARVTADKERIATELSVATSIQAGMLPNTFPPYPERTEFDIFASMNPAKEVGGDFYDFYLIDEHHLAVTIADVSGKGVPAALFMVIAKTILKNCVMMKSDNLAEAMERANNQLCEGNEESMFVTVFLGVLDTRSGELTFVNGGHNPPLLKTGTRDGTGGKFEYLKLRKNCMLGAMDGVQYHSQRVQMQPGDMLFLYTDGVTEAQNPAGGLYSEARLADVLNREPQDADAARVLTDIHASVAEYAGEAEQFDDITMLGLMYKGTP